MTFSPGQVVSIVNDGWRFPNPQELTSTAVAAPALALEPKLRFPRALWHSRNGESG
jgi:hypothetical protein